MLAVEKIQPLFSVGDKVEKVGGDYYFDGAVVAVFQKQSGEYRYVVENPHGVLHIYSAKNIQHRSENGPPNIVKNLLDHMEDYLDDPTLGNYKKCLHLVRVLRCILK